MITPATVYWIAQLDHIRNVVCGFTAVWIAASTVLFIMAFVSFCQMDNPGNEPRTEDVRFLAKTKKCLVITVCVSSVLITGLAFLPTSKSAAAMVVIPKIANSEHVQNISEGIVSLAEEWLKELAPKKNGGAK